MFRRRLPISPLAAVALAIVICTVGSVACDSNSPATPGTASPGTRVASDATNSENTDPAALFDDMASESGLDFIHFNGMSGDFYYAEMMGAGAALLDYDNDGDLDLYLVQGNLLGEERGKTLADAVFPPAQPNSLSDQLWRNDTAEGGELRFVNITQQSGLSSSTGYGMGTVAADFDNDGWVDLYVTNVGPNQLWHNRGDGTFEDRTARSGTGDRHWTVPALAFDYDGDGWLDLFLGNYLGYAVATDKPCIDELGQRNYCGPLAYPPLADRLLHNRGDGSFEDVSSSAGLRRAFGGALGASAADFDGDGLLDLYVANDGLPNQLWHNRGDGSFEDRALLAGTAVNGQGHAEASMGVAAADIDNDGDEDLFLSHLSRETHTLYRNDGKGAFADHSSRSGLGQPSWSFTGFGTAFFDYDNDGWLDLLVVHGAVKVIKELALAGDPLPLHQTNQLFHNLADGSFAEVTQRAGAVFALSEVSRGAAFGDLDNDGDTDVVVTQNSGPVRLLRNRVGQDASWLGVRLRSAKRDALGARARLERTDGLVLWRRAGSQSSYASSSDPRLLFGLGGSTAPVTVTVEWTGGQRETFARLSPGAYYLLRQGQGSEVEQ